MIDVPVWLYGRSLFNSLLSVKNATVYCPEQGFPTRGKFPRGNFSVSWELGAGIGRLKLFDY